MPLSGWKHSWKKYQIWIWQNPQQLKKHIVLFGVILFSCSVTRASAFWLRAVIVWLALIVCDVVLVLCASNFVQKLLFGWQRSCCFIHCMSLDRSLRTRQISLIKPSLGHITHQRNDDWNKYNPINKIMNWFRMCEVCNHEIQQTTDTLCSIHIHFCKHTHMRHGENLM